jgi:hypothetical protein
VLTAEVGSGLPPVPVPCLWQAIQRCHDLSPRSKAGRRDGPRWSGSFHSPSVALATFAAGAGLWLRQSWPSHDAPNPLPERCDRRRRVRVATGKESSDSFSGSSLHSKASEIARYRDRASNADSAHVAAEAFRRELGTKATQRGGPRCDLQVVVRNACGRYGSLASGLHEFEKSCMMYKPLQALVHLPSDFRLTCARLITDGHRPPRHDRDVSSGRSSKAE